IFWACWRNVISRPDRWEWGMKSDWATVARTISRAGDTGDANNNRAWVARVFARPTGLRGLQVGGAIYGDDITPTPALTGNPRFSELIESAHIVWTSETPELLSEFANVHHRDTLTGTVYNSQAYYVQ